MEVPLEFESMVAETQPKMSGKRNGKEVSLSSSGSASSSGPSGAGDAEQEHAHRGGLELDTDSSFERSPVSPGTFHNDVGHRMMGGRRDTGAGSGTSHPSDSLVGSSGYEPHDYYGYTGYTTEYGEQYYTTVDDVTPALDGMVSSFFGHPPGAWETFRRDDDDDQPADASSSWYFD